MVLHDHDSLVFHVEAALLKGAPGLNVHIDFGASDLEDFVFFHTLERAPNETHPRMARALSFFNSDVGQFRHEPKICRRLAGSPFPEPVTEGGSVNDATAESFEHPIIKGRMMVQASALSIALAPRN